MWTCSECAGDEPFVQKAPLEKLLEIFSGEKGKTVQVASLMQVLKEPHLIADPNYVKVAVNKTMDALLFSRSPIPYHRDTNMQPVYYEHIGVYAFRKQALMNFTNWPITPLEAAEKIECLRYLENGISLRMVVTDYMGIEIDTPEDLEGTSYLIKNSRCLQLGAIQEFYVNCGFFKKFCHPQHFTFENAVKCMLSPLLPFDS